jgi:hypothetical protein
VNENGGDRDVKAFPRHHRYQDPVWPSKWQRQRRNGGCAHDNFRHFNRLECLWNLAAIADLR